MNSNPTQPWAEENKRYLMAAIERVRAALQRHAGAPAGLPGAGADQNADFVANAAPRAAMTLDPPAAVDNLVHWFGLTPFERDVLLLCAGIELDAEFAPLCAAAQGDPQRNYPTFSLALAALPAAHWSALSPSAALRFWQLIHTQPDRPLTRGMLTIDERILHYLVGINQLDDSLAALLRPVTAPERLVPTQAQTVSEIVRVWSTHDGGSAPPVIQLSGEERDGKRAIAAAVGQLLGVRVYQLQAAVLPTEAQAIERLRRLWQRESALSGSLLLLDCDGLERGDHLRETAVGRLVEDTTEPLIVSARERLGPWQRPAIRFDIRRPTNAEQRSTWVECLGGLSAGLDRQLDQLVTQFGMSAPMIWAACRGAAARLADHPVDRPPSASETGATLWDVCREQARPQLDDLAERIDAVADWNDLILPDDQKQLLLEIGRHVRHRGQVCERWGFQSKGRGGLGVSALFAGPSGTGKTMAAEVLARELRLDLYRIDLSAVVSKYIGETEKNLRQVFDAAEAGGAILLFDEADALFGKRSEVKDSHDRHANIEVSYLLQRMESYRGLAILTTNLKDSLDQAFLRRLRFVVFFPFPDENQRAAIWERVFPTDLPTAGLDPRKLARLNVAGGNIRNIALSAAFMAAEVDGPVTMRHVAQAARREYAKLERTLTPSELRDW